MMFWIKRFARVIRTMLVAMLVIGIAAVSTAREPGEFFLDDAKTVVFFGDSITQNGAYVVYLDAYLQTRFPERGYTIYNRGISGETIAGTAEQGETRGNALDRFDRDIPSLNPDVLVACFGMNDAIYHPFSDERYAAYQNGARTLEKWTTEKTSAKLVWMAPPAFDLTRVRTFGPDSKGEYGYGRPPLDYDWVLVRYAGFLKSMAPSRMQFIDDNVFIDRIVMERRRTTPDFFVSGDAVHPNPTGHLLMAQSVLETWGAPEVAEVFDLTLSAKAGADERIRNYKADEGSNSVSFELFSKLPMPLDPAWDSGTMEVANTIRNLNQYQLRIKLPNWGDCVILGDGVAVGQTTTDELAEGLDLNRFSDFPTVKASSEVLQRIRATQQMEYDAWRKGDVEAGNGDQIEAQRKEIKELCQPRWVKVELKKR